METADHAPEKPPCLTSRIFAFAGETTRYWKR